MLIGGDFNMVNDVMRPYLARLYGDPAPSLDIAQLNGFAVLSWSGSAVGYQLQESSDFTLPNSWTAVTQPPITNGAQVSVTVPTTAPRKVFRLKFQ